MSHFCPHSLGPNLRWATTPITGGVVLYLEGGGHDIQLILPSGSPPQAPSQLSPITHITLGPHLTLLRSLLQFPITPAGVIFRGHILTQAPGGY